MRRPSALLGWLLILWTAAFAYRAVGQTAPISKQATFSWDEKQTLRMSVGYREVVDAATSAKLAGGLPTTIVMRSYVYPESGGDAVAATFKSCRVVFDLWDEIYRIEISQMGTTDVSTAASPTLEGVLRRCAEADRLLVAPRSSLLPSRKLYLMGIVEINPLSSEMLERIRRWVSRPSGATAVAPGDALFGSFVGLFVARIGTADRQIQFRTQAFVP